MPPPAPTPERDPLAILDIYLRTPEAHAYGIADVVQLWDRSTWWREGEAVVGLLDLAGSHVVYAIAAEAAEATLDLLRRLAVQLPDHLVATGPDGLADALCAAGGYERRWVKDYVKQHLARPGDLPPPDPSVEVLGPEDLERIEELFATDAEAGDFFHAGLLVDGRYVGIADGAGLVAVAGTHVIEPGHGVAAIANVVTRPERRGEGLGRRVVGTLCHGLLAEAGVIALNVRRRNAAARRLYGRLGFVDVLPYEEAELVRRSGR